MELLFVILMNGTIWTQTLDLGSRSDQICVAAAQELRKSDKVSSAFCVITDPNNNEKDIIGKEPKDVESHN